MCPRFYRIPTPSRHVQPDQTVVPVVRGRASTAPTPSRASAGRQANARRQDQTQTQLARLLRGRHRGGPRGSEAGRAERVLAAAVAVPRRGPGRQLSVPGVRARGAAPAAGQAHVRAGGVIGQPGMSAVRARERVSVGRAHVPLCRVPRPRTHSGLREGQRQHVGHDRGPARP